MKKLILIVVCTFFIVILFVLLYPEVRLEIEKFTSKQGKEATVSEKEKVIDRSKINLKYNQDIYFYECPSLIDYKTVELDDTNTYLVNTDSVEEVDPRIEAFMAKKRIVKINKIPLTANSSLQSGLDCSISIDNAKIQIKRIAKARNTTVERIDSLIMEHTTERLIRVLGPQKINVLFLNTELDKLK